MANYLLHTLKPHLNLSFRLKDKVTAEHFLVARKDKVNALPSVAVDSEQKKSV